MNRDPADIELSLRRRDGRHYTLEITFSQPESDADVRPLREAAIIKFDHERLRALLPDHEAYGYELFNQLLPASSPAALAFAKARSVAQSKGLALRVRIAIARAAGELQELHWETLRDPDDGTLIATGEQQYLSRYMNTTDWQPVRLRVQGDLKALVAIASPNDLPSYQLAPIDYDGERSAALAGLGTIETTVIPGDTPVTINTLATHMRGGYDIVYLVCHGVLDDDEPYLYLETDEGRTIYVAGVELVRRVAELAIRPRLIVLASCDSAAHAGESDAFTALGPQLAEVGVPAVLAMQGRFSMATLATMMPDFFRELQRDGQIDRALSVARGLVRDCDDFWVPTLFMRLKSGRIGYTPGFTGTARSRAEEKWEPLISSIRDGECTPIIGPDLIEGLIGSRRDLARRLAEDFHFPLAPHDREGLPQVAQFLGIAKSLKFLPHVVVRYLCDAIRLQQGGILPLPLHDLDLSKASTQQLLSALDTLLTHACSVEGERNPAESHKVLAELKVPIYITADPSNVLVNTLRAAGRDPQVMFCPWNRYTRQAPSPYTWDRDYDPDPQRPLVYRLFGSFQEPESLVLTEDDHFDYLIGVTQNKDLIPSRIRSILADTTLLFLGFRSDDWAFRIFYRHLMSQEGGDRRIRYAHIAVQVAPEEGRILSPQHAQRYLEDYFMRGAEISSYWGRAEDFMRALHHRL